MNTRAAVARPGIVRAIVSAAILILLAGAEVRADQARCTGDCSADAVVTVDELIGGVRVAYR